MNWLDIILIIIVAVFIIGAIVVLCFGISEDEIGSGIIFSMTSLFFAFVFIIPFIVLDKASGETIGTITSVDKNFFGTTALYVKTTETSEEKYCIEFNEELETTAKSFIGKKVKIMYNKRVGLYSTGKCHQAPIESIELID